MARLFYYQEQFNSGKLGKLMRGRSDAAIYKNGCKTLKNWRPTIQGPLISRKGTVFKYEVKDSSKKVRLVKFIFNETDNFTLEFGDQYIRFIQNVTQVGAPYEISTPYLEADLPLLKFAQIGDIMYITHPSYAPRKLTRLAAASWTLAQVDFQLGPVQAENTTATTVYASSGVHTVGGTSVITASSAIFTANQVGQVFKFKDKATSTVGYAKMTTFTSSTVCSFLVQQDISHISGIGNATTKWNLPAWNGDDGYPRAIAFHEQRLFFGGTTKFPLTVWGSSSNGAYENFDLGTAADDDALEFELAGQINTIQWLKSDGAYLIGGTLGGLAFVGAGGIDSALTPTNVKANVGTSFGASSVQGILLGDYIVYPHSNGQTLYEARYEDATLKYKSIDLCDFNTEILENGVEYLDSLEQPDLTAVCVSNGVLKMLSRDTTQEVTGWYEYEINGFVESVSVVPTTGEDRIWLVVRRTINGVTKRYIEYIEIDDVERELDSSVYYSGAATRTLSVAHLEGQTVDVLGSGSYAGSYVVTGGVITLPTSKTALTTAYIGLPYNCDIGIMPINIAIPNTGGTTQTLSCRINEVRLILLNALGLQIGTDFSSLDVIPNRNTNTTMTSAPVKYGADYPEVVRIEFNGEDTLAPEIVIRKNLPFSATLISLMAKMEVEID